MYKSQTFGRIFWVDDNYEFKSCPLCVDETGDFDCEDYVSEWTDWEGVDMNKLFNIHKFCILNKINYAGSLTHTETPNISNSDKVYPQVDNIPEQIYNDWLYNKDESTMREYKWDEQFYNEIVKDSTFSFGKFNENNYPLHLQQQ
jgi:hypothetical protein